MNMKTKNIFRKVIMMGAVTFVLGSCSDDFTAPDSPSGTTIAAIVTLKNVFI